MQCTIVGLTVRPAPRKSGHGPLPELRPPRGLLIVLSSPSGAGKTTISPTAAGRRPGDRMSVSATTRPMRPGEIDGRDYHFVDDAEFERMVDADELAEWAHVFNHRYGTPASPSARRWRHGRDILFDIDWQGTQQLQ